MASHWVDVDGNVCVWLPWKPPWLLLPVKGLCNWVPPFILFAMVSPHLDLGVFFSTHHAGVSRPDGFKAFSQAQMSAQSGCLDRQWRWKTKKSQMECLYVNLIMMVAATAGLQNFRQCELQRIFLGNLNRCLSSLLNVDFLAFFLSSLFSLSFIVATVSSNPWGSKQSRQQASWTRPEPRVWDQRSKVVLHNWRSSLEDWDTSTASWRGPYF